MYSGDILQKNKDYHAAIKDYSQAIKLGQNKKGLEYLHLYYFNRGNCYLKMKKYQLAILDFDRALEIFPSHFGSFANRGMAKFNTKDKSGACKDWEAAYINGYNSASQYIDKYCH